MTQIRSTSSTPLTVLIVGAGIGGLCAAIGLRQQGHHVTVVERSKLAEEVGAAIHIAPNCNSILHRLGLEPHDHGGIQLRGMTGFLADGSVSFSKDFSSLSKKWKYSWDLIHRAHLHTALKKLAESSDGDGPPVQLVLGCGAESVDPEAAVVRLRDGRELEGDVVIGADGVGSVSRKAIPGGDLTPFDSGRSAFRFLVPTQDLLDNERTRHYFQEDGHMVTWISSENKRIVAYPCESGATMNFAAMFPSEDSPRERGGDLWQQTANKDKMLEIFKSFGEDVASILDMADEPKVWTLLDMQQMPNYAYKRFAVLGDAAHPFLPYQGQGGAQAIEDAASLAVMLAAGTSVADVPDKLKLYEKERYERSSRIQAMTRQSGDDTKGGDNIDMEGFIHYTVEHDEHDASVAVLREHGQEVQVA